MIKQCADGVHIPFRIRQGIQISLFGGHVIQCAERWTVFVRHARLAKIAKPGVHLAIEQDVIRLEIAMQHTGTVGINESIADLTDDAHRIVNGQVAAGQKISE